MKKSLKILTLVLSLALICGALVVVAFAADTEVTGITTRVQWNFTNENEGPLDYPTDKYHRFSKEPKRGTGNSMWDSRERYGIPEIVSQDDGNKYFQWTGATNEYAKSNNGYVAIGVNTVKADYYETDDAGYYTGKTTQPGAIDKYDFVIDLDVYLPDGYTFPTNGTGASLKFHVNGVGYEVVDGKVTTKVSSCSNLIPQVNCKGTADGSYLEVKGNKYYVDSNSWTHVTMAITYELATTADGTEYMEEYVTVWFNGDVYYHGLWGTTLDPNIAGGGTKYTPADYVTAFGGDSFRVQVTTGAATETDAIALDNPMVRLIERSTYNGNLYDVIEDEASLTEWESNVYNRANMPYGKTVVKNLTTEAEYDNLQYALDMAETGDELALCANVVSDVIVNKEIVLTAGEYTTGSVEPGKGYAVYYEDGVYTSEQSEGVTVAWGDCVCGLDDACDETHPGGIETEVGIGGKILRSYVKAGKSADWSLAVGYNSYKLIGWEDADGNLYTADSVMTAELAETCGGYLELTPIIDISIPVYKYYKDGKEVLAFAETTTLKQAVDAADADTTFYLLGDVRYNGENIEVKKNLTVDLNGYSIVAIQDKDASKASGLFNVYNTFTLTTSVEGGCIIAAKDMGAEDAANSFQGAPIIRSRTTGTVVTIDGSKGLTTYSAQLYCADVSNGGYLYVNGGTYVEPVNAQDSWGYIQMHELVSAEFKNATFVRKNWRNCGMIALMGNGIAPESTVEVTIDNCAFIGSATVCEFGFPELKVTITNSYIGGTINPTRGADRSGGRNTTDLDKGTWILGEGNYIASGATIGDNVKVAEGYEIVDTSISETYNYMVNNFYTGNVEASLKLEPDTIRTAYNRVVAKSVVSITVNWVDAEGNSLGTTEAKPGEVATSPAVSVADGWVNASYSATVPADATGTYTVTVDENTEVVYTAGKVPAYMNYDLIMHFQFNIYVPSELPKGVSNVAYTRNGTARKLSSTNFVVDGKKMSVGSEWPGAMGADNDYTITITYEYGGQSIVYEIPKFNMGDYAKAILNGDYSTEIKQVMLATLNYVDAANKATTPVQTTSAEVTEAIALAAELGIAVENVTIDTNLADNDYSGISEYINSARLGLGQGITIYLTKSQKAIEDDVVVRFTAESGNAYTDGSATSVSTWYWNNTRAYQLNDNVKIEILDGIERDADGKYVAGTGTVVASCDYSVLANAAAIWDLPETTAEMKTLVIAALTMGKYVEYIV